MASSSSGQRGAVLLLTVLVILIVASLSFAVTLLNHALQAAAPEAKTVQAYSNLEKAFARFVTSNRRLPCGADGRIASTVASAGVEQRNNTTGDCITVNFGVVPWITLQIAEADASDGWGNRLTYRVPTGAAGFTRNLAFDMSSCAATGTAATTVSGGAVVCFARAFPCAIAASCTNVTNYVLNRGIRVNDATGAPITNPATGTGAAYIVTSAGANFFGAYNSAGLLMAAQGSAAGTGEVTNSNNTPLQAAYVDAPRDTSATATHYDDVMLRPPISTVLTQAQLGPRL